METPFFNAHHAPIGAFASFTLGYKGASGGFGMELPGPACQNVYIGTESRQPGKFLAFPFFSETQSMRERFEQASGVKESALLSFFPDEEIRRQFSLTIDTWSADDLEFTVYSQVRSIPDPDKGDDAQLKSVIVPAVFVDLTLDNSRGSVPRLAFFGYQGNDPYCAMRRIGESGEKTPFHPNRIFGIGQGRLTAICTDDPGVDFGLAFSIEELLDRSNNHKLDFGLGMTGAILMTAQPGEKRTWRFALCFYRSGFVTSGIETEYYYTRFFRNIEDVARYALETFSEIKQACFEVESRLAESQLSDDRKFLLSQSVRSYYGSTQLMQRANGSPLWIVNEGEYRMINTFDLLVDHLFFETSMNPWAVRNVLDLFVERYSYFDTVRFPDSEKDYPGGISFTHDMGVGNVFSRDSFSAYELGGLKGCFSYMTHEQLVNWILCAAVYWKKTADESWLQSKREVITACIQSMLNRDSPEVGMRDGVMDLDSFRAAGGWEITTYDNVDEALGRARRSVYLAVKCWAAYILLHDMLKCIGEEDLASVSCSQARLTAATVLRYRKNDSTIPALLVEGYESVSLSVVEGLAFLYQTGHMDKMLSDPLFAEFVSALKEHFAAVLKKGLCLFEDGGWKLSSTSENSWLSKIFLNQSISEQVFGMKNDELSDSAHVSWLMKAENSFFAFSDQMRSGIACGSKYYPRGVTSCLWTERLFCF